MGCMPRPALVLGGLLWLSCAMAAAQTPAESNLDSLIGEYEQLIRTDDPVSAGQ